MKRKSRHVPRIHVDRPLAVGDELSLESDKAHHLRTVLRLGAGAPAVVFNGSGGEYLAEVGVAGKRAVTLRLTAHCPVQRESPLTLTLAQGIARGERMDFAIGKAIELGVAAIQPLFTDRGQVRLRGERLAKKTAHWQRVAVSAAEQSGRERVPEVAAPILFSAFLANPPPACALLLDPQAETRIATLTQPRAATLLVGPESGLSETETRLAITAGYTAVSLGPRVLRTETAGIAALAAMQALWGDL